MMPKMWSNNRSKQTSTPPIYSIPINSVEEKNSKTICASLSIQRPIAYEYRYILIRFYFPTERDQVI